MTRTTKANDIPHNNPEAAALMVENQLPKFFGKQGFVDTAPSKTKKDGGGKGNWGHPGDELEELEEFNINRARRRSNSNNGSARFEIKSKFEINEPEPVFEEDKHGPIVDRDDDGETLSEVASTTDSAPAGSSGSGEAFRPWNLINFSERKRNASYLSISFFLSLMRINVNCFVFI